MEQFCLEKRESGVVDDDEIFFIEGVGKISCVVGKEREGLIILNFC